MNIFKIIFDPILDALRDKTVEMLYDESNKVIVKVNKDERLQWENKLLTLHSHLKGWIENDIEIPKYIKKEYPFNVADYCVKVNKAYLVKDLLPDYYKRLKIIEQRDRIDRTVNAIFKIIEYTIIGICISTILILLYSIMFGEPSFIP